MVTASAKPEIDFYASDPSDGTAQSQRFPQALRSGYFAIDELSFDELLVLGTRLAENIKYFGADNKEAGTWDDLLARDPAFVLAEIASTNTTKLEAMYAACAAKQSIPARADFIFRLAAKLDSWSRALFMSGQSKTALLNKELSQIIKNFLAEKLVDIGRILALNGEKPPVTQDRYRSLAKPPRKIPASVPEQQRYLDTSFHCFLGAINYLKNTVDSGFDAGEDSRDQNPAVSLFIAFLKLYSHVQDTINKFPDRRLDFYYSRILQAKTRPLQPDAVNLALTLAPGQSPFLLPAGTQFLAGKDASEKDIMFATKEDVTLTTAEVRTARTVFFDRNRLISPEHELGCVTRIKATELDVGSGECISYPLFGAASSANADEAEMGLAVASPLLHLREGERRIVLEFECEVNTGLPDDLAKWLADAGSSKVLAKWLEDAGLPNARWLADAVSSKDLAKLLAAAGLPNLFVKWVADADSAGELVARLAQIFVRELMSDSLPLSAKLEFSSIEKAARRLFGADSAADHVALKNVKSLLQWERDQPLDFRLRDFFGLRSAFRQQLGQWLAQELIFGAASFSSGAKSILSAAEILFSDHPTFDVIGKMLEQEPSALFYRLLRDSFDIRLTTEQGWLPCNNYVISPLPDAGNGPAAGLRLELLLGIDDPAITAYQRAVHKGDFTTDQPIASLRINPHSMFFAYTLFASLNIRALNLTVNVCGAKALVAYNDFGQLDCSKSFIPFGAQPTRDSFLAIGHYEAARKPLTQANLNIQWGGLPPDFGGFAEYYSGYTTDFSDESLRARVTTLASNAWSGGTADTQLLFTTVAQTGQVGTDCRLDLLQGRRFATLQSDVPETEYRLNNRSRAGFFRIDLSLCEDPFGHVEYPRLVTTTLLANAKKRKPLPLPQPPYTPLINRISLDYSAQSSIRFRTESSAPATQTGNKLFHHHPFGTVELAQTGRERPVSLMPRFAHDGYLLLGLSGEHPLGVVNLLFELSDGRPKNIGQGVQSNWYYLCANQFTPLPKTAILHDTTANFTASGIVTIDLPDDISLGNTIFAGDYFWLAVGARGDVSLSPHIHAVKTNGLKAVRQLSQEETSIEPVAHGTIREAVSAPPGIAAIEQPADSFGGQPAEDHRRLITRTAERLHHKGRACQPWDYERLVLERFPDIYKVKCFANMSMDNNQPTPGAVLIVVVPRVVEANTGQTQQLRVDTQRLEQVQQYLATRMPPFARVSVRNAVYERVQVRCSVKLHNSAYDGKHLRDLNQVISDFISPWRPGGYGASFGWRIRRKDIEACIGALSYVEFVTDFSMLHITQERENYYRLQDTAPEAHGENATPSAEAVTRPDTIAPHFPWSLALPSRRHFIQTISAIVELPAEPTGVGELEVGSTLILNSGNHGG